MVSPNVMARLRSFIDRGIGTHQRGQSMYIGHPGIFIRAMDGMLTPAGQAYDRMVRETGAIPETRIFHHNAVPVMANGVEKIRDRSGNMRHTRMWDPSLNNGAGAWKFTHAGRLFHSTGARGSSSRSRCTSTTSTRTPGRYAPSTPRGAPPRRCR